LEEIDEIFVSSKSVFDTVKVAKNLPHGRLADLVNEDEQKVEGGGAPATYLEDTEKLPRS
jgi:hypothetical protein